MGILSRVLVLSMVLTGTAPAAAQQFASRLNGTWEETYCGDSRTTFRIYTQSPQRTWVAERFCNFFGCDEVGYQITQIHPPTRVFTVRAVAGGAVSPYEIRFEVAEDGQSMQGTYRDHPRCNANELRKVSPDAGATTPFTVSVAALPSPSAPPPPPVRPSLVPEDVRMSPFAEIGGSTACLVSGAVKHWTAPTRYDGGVIAAEERWVHNTCNRAVQYAMFEAGTRRIAPRITHRWMCEYERYEDLWGEPASRMSYCRLLNES